MTLCLLSIGRLGPRCSLFCLLTAAVAGGQFNQARQRLAFARRLLHSSKGVWVIQRYSLDGLGICRARGSASHFVLDLGLLDVNLLRVRERVQRKRTLDA